MNLWSYAKRAGKLAPWIGMAILALVMWLRPAPGSNSSAGQQVQVAGEEALTKAAKKKWKKRKPVVCKDVAGEFKIVTREVPPEELERLARQYGFTFGDVGEVELFPLEDRATTVEGVTVVPVSRMFGEYTAPRLRYGGTVAAALLVNGELEMRFDPSPSPKFGLVGSFGLGGIYDMTSLLGQTEQVGHSRIYGFAELFQTKEVFWRVEVGGLQLAEGWDEYIGVGVEWRTEPLWQGRKKGLRSVKAGE